MKSVTPRLDDTEFARRLADVRKSIARTRAALASSQKILEQTKAGLQGSLADAFLRQPQPSAAAAPSSDQAFEEFSRLLESSGLRDALAYILKLSPYRFIGIFRFEGGLANAAVHFDREQPDQLTADEVPDTATYCSFVRETRSAFITADAVNDPLLGTHVAREVIQAYCGLPLMTADGVVLGTLCHYDVVPRDPDTLDWPLLLRVASALEEPGRVPPYPARRRAAGQD